MFALLIAGKMTREGSQSSLDLYQGSHFDEGAIKMEIQFRQGARQGIRAAKSTYFLRFNRVFRIGLNMLKNRLMNTITRMLQDYLSITVFKSGAHLKL